eukprot:TRINITY_DN28907_c0_g1_i1.p1 TRINITY_DN28907_c0_g1~~TRINITY_DN28907_c0_g1_i1.p1  ORF type:complete len:456 (-),score=36.00 TRINITY_DN28907_c0_g1_i1:230-1597(-)
MKQQRTLSTQSSSSQVSSTVNLINNVIGAGLFSMPLCVMQSSIVGGATILLAICALNVLSFRMLAYCCSMTDSYSYFDIGNAALGPRFGRGAQIIAMCYACGSLISYVVLTNDFLLGEGTGLLYLLAEACQWVELRDNLSHDNVIARVVVGLAFSLLFFLPWCMCRRLDSLKWTSWLALMATLYVGFICCWEVFMSPNDSLTPEEVAIGHEKLRESVVVADFNMAWFASIPIVNVAFTAHYNAPRYYQELTDRSVPRYACVTSFSLLAALLVYLVVGVSGYAAFGQETQEDVLKNFAESYKLAVGARIALLVVLISCYPKVQHSLRDAIIRLTYADHWTTDTLPSWKLVRLTLVIVGASTLVGTLVSKVSVVLRYNGAIFGSLMVYVCPALMYTAASVEKTVNWGSTDSSQLRSTVRLMLTRSEHLGPALLFVWGCVTGVLGVVLTVEKQLTHQK